LLGLGEAGGREINPPAPWGNDQEGTEIREGAQTRPEKMLVADIERLRDRECDFIGLNPPVIVRRGVPA
jgi:hypothetical protein